MNKERSIEELEKRQSALSFYAWLAKKEIKSKSWMKRNWEERVRDGETSFSFHEWAMRECMDALAAYTLAEDREGIEVMENMIRDRFGYIDQSLLQEKTTYVSSRIDNMVRNTENLARKINDIAGRTINADLKQETEEELRRRVAEKLRNEANPYWWSRRPNSY